MDSVIDSLSLKIDIDIEKGIDKTISNLAKSIIQLNKAVENADVKGLKTYVNTLSKFTTTNIKVSIPSISMGNVSNMGNVAGIENVLQKTKVAVDSTTPSIENLRQKISNVRLEMSNNVKTLKAMNEELGKTGKNAKKNAKELDIGSKSFSKLIRSIGRIAFYRTIRTAISSVTNALKEGFSNFVQYSDSANKSMSSVANSIGQLKNTLGVTAGAFIQTLEPVITTLVDGVTELVNQLNMAMASISGKDTYAKAIKQNEDYAKSLDKTKSKLLSFDKFEALSSGDEKTNPAQMFEEVEVPKELSETANIFNGIISAVKELWDILTGLFTTLSPLIQPIIDILLVVIKIIGQIFDIISPILDVVIDVVSGILEQISGALEFISGIISLLTGDFDGAWKSIANGFASMVNGMVNMFIGFVNMCIDALNTLIKPIDWIAEIFGGNVEIPHIEWKMNWQPYADGGNFSKGTAFYAGEAGAEIVYNKRTGSTSGGVLNIEQFTTAMVDALTIYGASQGNMRDLSGMGVYIDRTKAGQVLENSIYNEGVRVGHFSKR